MMDGGEDDVTSLRHALTSLAVDDAVKIIRSCSDFPNMYLDSRKYRNALHYLVTSYCSRVAAKRSVQTLGKFASLLAVLLENGLDINEHDVNGHTALHLAASHIHSTDVIEVLLSSGANVRKLDRSQQSALHKAAHLGTRTECLKLIEAGSDVIGVDCRGFTPLHAAASRKSCDILELLLSKGANVNQQSVQGKKKMTSALHVACRNVNLPSVEFLVRNGANLELVEGSGQTALHVAAAHDVTGKVVLALLKARANANVQDELFGETPLHKALIRGMHDSALCLLSNGGAWVNVPDARGDTALHTAARHCHVMAVWTALLKTRPNKAMLNRHGYAAKDVASRGKNSVALSMLRQHDELIDAKSPRLTPRALHTRDITSVSPNIVRRNNALLST